MLPTGNAGDGLRSLLQKFLAPVAGAMQKDTLRLALVGWLFVAVQSRLLLSYPKKKSPQAFEALTGKIHTPEGMQNTNVKIPRLSRTLHR